MDNLPSDNLGLIRKPSLKRTKTPLMEAKQSNDQSIQDLMKADQ